MSLSLKPSADGLSAVLQVGGVDVLKMGAGAAGDPLEVAKKTDIANIFTKEFKSAEQTITSAGLLTIAHGLGVRPKFVVGEVVCKVADAGYSVGDVVELPLTAEVNSTAHHGVSARKDATNLYLRFGSNATALVLLRGDNGVSSGIANTSWKLVVRAYG